MQSADSAGATQRKPEPDRYGCLWELLRSRQADITVHGKVIGYGIRNGAPYLTLQFENGERAEVPTGALTTEFGLVD
jgi:hypothetical protein